MKITNQSDFIDIEKKENILRVSPNDVEIEDVDDIWDGPLSGGCLFQNTERYFFCVNNVGQVVEDLGSRKYVIINLTQDQQEKKVLLDKRFVDLRNHKLSIEEYERFLSDLSISVNVSQVIAWFSINEQSHETLFMKSYFKTMSSKTRF